MTRAIRWPLVLVLVLGMSFSLMGCLGSDDDDDDNPAGPSGGDGPLMPLAVGNSWTYELTYGTHPPMDVTMEIVSQGTRDGRSAFAIAQETSWGSDTFYVALDTSGGDTVFVQNAYWAGPAVGDWYLGFVFDESLANGTEIYREEFSGGAHSALRVIDTAEAITVPAGSYTAFHVRSEYMTSTFEEAMEWWFVPGVGPVKVVEYNGDPGADPISSQVLKSVSLN